jgi:hypothetical protein
MSDARITSGARSTVLLPVLLLAAGICGCPPPPQSQGGAARPDAILEQYADHVSHGRLEQAYALLSSRLTHEISPEEFEQFISRHGQRTGKSLSSLASRADATPSMRATWTTPDGASISMVRESGKWKVDTGTLVPQRGFSPESAVEQLLQAIEAGDCQAVIACAPPGVRGNHAAEKLLSGCRDKLDHLKETAARIRKSGAKPHPVSEDRAELTYHHSRKLVVIRYKSRWYVEDL